MDDQFDKDLKKRIREVFDNYEDATPDKGWALLREKYPEKGKRSIAWIWWASAAAVLLLFLGILWFNQSPEKQQQQVAGIKKSSGHSQQPQIAATNNSHKPGGSTTNHQPDHLLTGKRDQTPTINPGVVEPLKQSAATTSKQALAAANMRVNTPANKATLNSPVINDQNNNASIASTSANTTTLASNVKPADNNPANRLATAKTDTGRASALKSNLTAAVPGINMQQAKKSTKDLLADNYQPSKQKGLSNSLVHFGVYAATYFNYAKGSSSQFNVGAGLSADISLSRKFKVSTGIALAQNSLSYPGQQPAFSTPTGINLAPLSVYSANALQYSVSEPTFRNYSADLVGIDIPVNLKYTFDPGKSETYLLAGLSSGTFINETYTYNFNSAQAQSQSTRNGLGGFYFARTLNLAIGTGYRIGGNRLIVEPFLKYPLEGLGTQQIRFGSGGINLKFSIPSLKR